jgi:hypothetical protein
MHVTDKASRLSKDIVLLSHSFKENVHPRNLRVQENERKDWKSSDGNRKKGTGTKRDSINLDLSGHHKEQGLESDQ